MIQPPLHMRAMPPMFSFQPNCFAASRINMKPWAYDTILDAYSACVQQCWHVTSSVGQQWQDLCTRMHTHLHANTSLLSNCQPSQSYLFHAYSLGGVYPYCMLLNNVHEAIQQMISDGFLDRLRCSNHCATVPTCIDYAFFKFLAS